MYSSEAGASWGTPGGAESCLSVCLPPITTPHGGFRELDFPCGGVGSGSECLGETGRTDLISEVTGCFSYVGLTKACSHWMKRKAVHRLNSLMERV